MPPKGHIQVFLDLIDKGFRAKLDQNGTATGKFARELKQLAAAYISIRGAQIAYHKALESTKLNVQYEAMTRSLDNLTAAYQTNARTMLGDLRKATRGTISDVELLKKANMGLALQLAPETISQFGEAAVTIAKATGQSVEYMFQSLMTGTARQSRLWLDNLGILVSVEDAQKEYAESVGKTVEQLTEGEKRQAFINKVMKEAKEITDRVGGAVDDLNTDLQRFEANAENFKTHAGSIWRGIFGSLLKWANPALDALAEMMERLNWISQQRAGQLTSGIQTARQEAERIRGVLAAGAEPVGFQNPFMRDTAEGRNFIEVYNRELTAERRANLETAQAMWDEQVRTLTGQQNELVKLEIERLKKRKKIAAETGGGGGGGGDGEGGLPPLYRPAEPYSMLAGMEESIALERAQLEALHRVADATSAIPGMEEAMRMEAAELAARYAPASETSMLPGAEEAAMLDASDARAMEEALDRARATTEAWVGALVTVQDVLSTGIQGSINTISYGISSGLVDGTYDWAEAWKHVERQIAAALIKLIITQGVMLAITAMTGPMGAAGGKAGGQLLGGILGFHTGGPVPRHHAGVLSSREHFAVLQEGEYVQPRSAVQSIGVENMEYMRRTGRMPGGGEVNLVVHNHFTGPMSRSDIDYVMDKGARRMAKKLRELESDGVRIRAS